MLINLKSVKTGINEIKSNLKYDLPAGFVVFLVAMPLCLGIALASGAPLFSGIIAGICGGLIVPLISKAPLSVSGPAAGLTAIVLMGIEKVGTFEGFLVAVFLGGLLQIILGLVKAGTLSSFFPSSVIRGMLAGIGLIVVLKQWPHAIGYDIEQFGADRFKATEFENTFTLLMHSFRHIEKGAIIIGLVSIAILIVWAKTRLKNINWLQGALVVVITGILANQGFGYFLPGLKLDQTHLVSLPPIEGFNGFIAAFRFPDRAYLLKKEVLTVAVTMAIVASIETLLTIKAIDGLDPFKRKTPPNRELIAQGVGNTIAGLIGGIPLTSVIIRGAANASAGARTGMSAFFHGLLLLLSVMFIAQYLNMIPLASLACILLSVGYKLAGPAVFKEIYRKGLNQFLPFVMTIIAILLTDLLIGILIGICIGLVFVLRTNFHTAISMTRHNNNILIRFNKDVSFLNKALLQRLFDKIDSGSHVIIECKRAKFIDHDIHEMIDDFRIRAAVENINVHLENVSFRTMEG
ncbi:MAG: SulP family inorganic anion transporter [Candidatus Anammoxibacter sp.]